jgi:hypothetical protein
MLAINPIHRLLMTYKLLIDMLCTHKQRLGLGTLAKALLSQVSSQTAPRGEQALHPRVKTATWNEQG